MKLKNKSLAAIKKVIASKKKLLNQVHAALQANI
jgi:hypothetical protein